MDYKIVPALMRDLDTACKIAALANTNIEVTPYQLRSLLDWSEYYWREFFANEPDTDDIDVFPDGMDQYGSL